MAVFTTSCTGGLRSGIYVRGHGFDPKTILVANLTKQFQIENVSRNSGWLNVPCNWHVFCALAVVRKCLPAQVNSKTSTSFEVSPPPGTKSVFILTSLYLASLNAIPNYMPL